MTVSELEKLANSYVVNADSPEERMRCQNLARVIHDAIDEWLLERILFEVR